VPAALGGVAGAVTSVLAGSPDTGDGGWSLVPPEVAGMRVVARSAWPLVLAIAGTLPVLAARAAADGGDGSPYAAAGNAAVAAVVVFGLVAWWVRKRDHLHAAWKAALDQAFPDKTPRQEGTAGA
jgi:hypothetical protein